jgi:replicative DNA helicase
MGKKRIWRIKYMDQVLPHNIESEKIVLGSILSNINAFSEVNQVLTTEMFYDKFNQELYQDIVDINKKGKAADIVILSEKYMNSPKKLQELINISGMFSVDYYDHALNIQEKYVRRKLWMISQQLTADIFSQKETDDLLYFLYNNIDQITQTVGAKEVLNLKDAIRGVYNQIETNLKGNYVTGTDTGFKEINKVSGGLQQSDLIIVAGETSQGKTSLALSIVNNAAKQGVPIAIYSLEMRATQLAARLLSMNTGIPSNQILYSKLDDEYLRILDSGVSMISDFPIYFDDNSTSNIDKIIASIRSLKNRYDISGAVIDYLQILNVNQRSVNKEQAMGDVARRLKNLAKELNIWIMALSQLNRNDQNPIPTLNRLRDSGQIGEAADMVIFIYRPEFYGKYYPDPFANYSTKGTAMIDIAKGRNIGLLKFICAFDPKTTHFSDLKDFVKIEEKTPF